MLASYFGTSDMTSFENFAFARIKLKVFETNHAYKLIVPYQLLMAGKFKWRFSLHSTQQYSSEVCSIKLYPTYVTSIWLQAPVVENILAILV